MIPPPGAKAFDYGGHMWRWLFLLGACSMGGGPVIGYGQRGLVLGGEGGGGFLGIEATAGYENGLIYGRLDGNFRGAFQTLDGSLRETTRVGLGAGFTRSMLPDGEHQSWHPIATAGAGIWRSTTDAEAQCQAAGGTLSDVDANVFSATVELRYAGQFEIVVVPRYQRMSGICPPGG